MRRLPTKVRALRRISKLLRHRAIALKNLLSKLKIRLVNLRSDYDYKNLNK
jgi:hypothetical protein